MTMVSNNRNGWLNPSYGNARNSFQEHNEHMKGFRRSHTNVAMVNAPRCDECALLESMCPLQVSHTIIETGGARCLNSVMVWSALVSVLKVARYKLSQN